MKKILLASALALLPLSAQALEVRPVVGVDYNYSKVGLNGIYDDVFEDTYHSFSGVIGTKISQYFGIEAFYEQSLDEDGYSGLVESNFNAFGAEAVFYVPLVDKLELVPSIGLGRYEVEAEILNLKDSEDGLGIRGGLALQYNFTDNVAIRAGGRYVWLSNFDSTDDIMQLTAGLRFTF